MRKLIVLSVLGLLTAGCGSSGDEPGMSRQAEFLTADAGGVSTRLNPGGGVPAPPEGYADLGAPANDARADIVRAIEEADIYRVSGNLLYLLNAWRGLVIVDLAGPALEGRLALAGVPLEMYLRGDRGFVLVAAPQGGTTLLEIGVADPAQPRLSRTHALAGSYRTSRMVGDVLYVVTDQAVHSFQAGTAPFTPAASLALGTAAGFAHATNEFIFVAGSNEAGATTVTLVDVSDPGGALALRGSLELTGYVSDDQKLNFGGGVLRVVTHDWNDGGLSRLSTVDIANPDAPAVLATLELARGEQLFATQFTANRAYIVTFEQVDPLWVIDLADPAHPVIAGELVVPGYSTQMVADGTQLMTIGLDPDLGWQTVVSLFDVSNPAAPALLDRENLGDSSSSAVWERKALGVYPDRVLAPRWDGLAVIDRGADSLALRGVIGVAGGALRGFPHSTGLVAVGSEEVVTADALTLDVIGRVTIAENVVDVGRLADGTLLRLVQAGEQARLNGAEVKLWAEALYPHGNAAAITGWDTNGRAAYVVTFDQDPPRVSARLDLNSAGTPVSGGIMGGMAGDFAGGGAALVAPAFSGAQEVLTNSGKLVLRGIPGGNPHSFGQGNTSDGLIVVDIPGAALVTGVAVRDAAITGFAADGSVLALTMASYAGQDDLARPLLRNEYVRVDLNSGEDTSPVNVPGYVVAARGSDLYTVEESWGEDWSVTSNIVASRLSNGVVSVLDRLALPAGAYDLRATGATLFFSTGGAMIRPMYDVIGGPDLWVPDSHIGTVRLGAALAPGAEISGPDAFRTLLLPEDGAALISRDGFAVERWELGGATATLDWEAALPGYPLSAHADTANAGQYLLALGYGGELSLP